jgi:magnesium-transporting ATPase (P-type)
MLLAADRPIWCLPQDQVPPALRTTALGLEEEEARRRLERYGANRLPALRRRPLGLRLLDQMLQFMALLLWLAG